MSATLLTMALILGTGATSELVLIEEGQSRCAIVIPDAASPTVRQAAEELAAYLKQMSGAQVPIGRKSAAAGTVGIHVGPTEVATEQAPAGLFDEEERVFIKADAEGVVICGGSDRGTLFAAYRFLELLGCRWLAPGPENEVVPQCSTLSVPVVRIDTRPAFAWRLFKATNWRKGKTEGDAGLGHWGIKVGMNGLYWAESAKTNGECFFWPDEVPGVHAYRCIIPNERYFAKHPEWFSLLAGKRQPGDQHGRQLCVTAPGLVEEFAANVIRIFDSQPNCRMMSISPNDGRGWCECPACTALDKRLCGGRVTRQGLAAERPFRGDRVFWFANEVGQRVAKKHPDKKLLVLAYINYAEPPDTIKPEPNVVPFLCHYAPADYARAIADPESEPNRQFNELLQEWVKITPEVLIYSYVSKSMWWRLPRPVLHNFAADIKHFHRLGIRRYYCQSSLTDWALDGPLYYVIARLLWDPGADPDAIVQEWMEHMFGPAAAEMTAFYRAVEAAVRKTGKPYSDNPPRDVPGLYDRQSLDEALAAIDRAEKIKCDDRVGQRLARVAETFRYGYWMTQALELSYRFGETADPEAMKAAITARDRALDYCKVSDAQRRTSFWELTAEMGVVTVGFGKAETKGGRRCWNADETGIGDNANGWATFLITPKDRTRPVLVEMDVWGESSFSSVVINSAPDVWNRVRPEKRLVRKPEWQTMVFRIEPDLYHPNRVGQKIGFGGADNQAWIAEIRFHQPSE